MVLLEEKVQSVKKQKIKIPKELIYEKTKGKTIYYRDYKAVLKGEKTSEEIMGSSILQGILIALIIGFLYTKLDRKKYTITTNELGIQFDKRSWRLADIAIFETEKVKNELYSTKYVKTPPKIVIEIDTKADLSKNNDILHYIDEKNDDLFNFGVEKIVWIFTEEKKLMVCVKNERWFITNWEDTIDLIDDVKLNINKLLENK